MTPHTTAYDTSYHRLWHLLPPPMTPFTTAYDTFYSRLWHLLPPPMTPFTAAYDTFSLLLKGKIRSKLLTWILFFFTFQEERHIYDSFSQEEFTSKFINFLSLEDRKGKDKFNLHRFMLFKVRNEA